MMDAVAGKEHQLNTTRGEQDRDVEMSAEQGAENQVNEANERSAAVATRDPLVRWHQDLECCFKNEIFWD